MVLERHGLFTFGATAKESYEGMIDAVTACERYIERHAKPRSSPDPLDSSPRSVDESRARWSTPSSPSPSRPTTSGRPLDEATTARVVAILRGSLARLAGDGIERAPIVALRTSPPILSFLERPDATILTQRGCATPDHVLRTKPWPLHVATPSYDDLDALTAQLDHEVEGFARRYDAYFEETVAKKGVTRKKLDPGPCVVLLPRVGLCAVGKTKREAEMAGDIYEHTLDVITAAERIGAYCPLGLDDLFDVEYWSLEQAKLKKEVERPLARRVALVTGAASGIGRATAAVLVELGAHVVLCDRDAANLAAVAGEIGKKPHVATAVCDVTRPDDVARAFAIAACTFGGVDIVVSNAGAAAEGKLETAEGEVALRSSLEINLLSHANVARYASETMIRQRRGGCLLFNASKSAFNQGPGFGPYAVAKAALVSLMRQYAIDLARHGIRSNAVNADRVRTNIFGGGMVESRAKARGISVDEYFRSNLLSREVTARDVGDAFAYLAQAQATTGCVITVDGGNAAAFPR
jgi:NAD(P)-dependent dehydrogenase (short-subunit alcohol dehydrogenase family)